MRYVSKPQEIEAVQWTGFNYTEVREFVCPGWPPEGEGDEEEYVEFNHEDGLILLAGKFGAQGHVEVPVGHWIVRQPGDLTDHWPVDPDYLARKYEPVECTP